jgi:soluble lytic murein transglycosylase-like protein
MQVLPSTAQWIGQTVGRKLDPLNPYDNAVAGVVYIGYLQRNASSVSQGIGAYYQGLGGIKKNGAQKDTKDYIKKVKSYM